ncbi:MAG: glycosyltransferase family 2 protein, partial [Lachnospiraceae bacterium]|nr:glycosyltransferase family 2 protein [Lachnospiraceae bacterium]
LLFREGIAKGPSGLSEKEAEKILENIYPDPHYRVEASKEELVKQRFPDKFDIHIIMPVYNGEAYVKGCVESVLSQQTSASVLLTIINNGSTDRSMKIINKILKQPLTFLKIEVLEQENKGPGGGRNRALDAMQGKYVLFLDADDRLLPGALEMLFLSAKMTGADIVQGNPIQFVYDRELPAFAQEAIQSKDENLPVIQNQTDEAENDSKVPKGQESGNGNALPKMQISDSALTLLDGYCWGKLYKSALWEEIRFTEYSWFEDTPVFFLIYPQAKKAARLEANLYAYRVNPTGLSSKANSDNPKLLDTWYVSRETLKTALKKGIDFHAKDVQKQLARQMILNAKRVRPLGRAAQEALFVLQASLVKDLLDEAFEGLDRKEKTFMKLLQEGNWNKFRVLGY